MKKVLLPVLGILFLFVSSVSLLSNTVTFAWDRNTEPDISGYNIYCSQTSGQYTVANKVNMALIPHPTSGTTVGFIYTSSPNVKLFCVVRAVNQATLESANSNEVTANPLPPSPPTGFRITGLTTTLFVDQQQVASTQGDNLTYTLTIPRQSPPRIVKKILTVTVEP
jgi:hypothetical protein